MLALALAVCMAVPAFAQARYISSPVGHIVQIVGYGKSSGPVLQSNGISGANTPVTVEECIWNALPLTQRWRVNGSVGGTEGQIFSMYYNSGTSYAVNLWRTQVSSGVYPVTLAAVTGNLDDTTFHFSNYDGHVFYMWLSQGTFAGYRLYIDKSDPSSQSSDVYFVNSTKTPNTSWYWRSTSI